MIVIEVYDVYLRNEDKHLLDSTSENKLHKPVGVLAKHRRYDYS